MQARRGALPLTAVAAGRHLFLYRSLRPYYKFVLPDLPIDRRESEAWEEVCSDASGLRSALAEARDAGIALSRRSRELLAAVDDTAADEMVALSEGVPLVRHDLVTCMEARAARGPPPRAAWP